MKLLSIIIPVFNEEKTIKQVIDRIQAVQLPKGFNREIIVINDGSNDGTREILKEFVSSCSVIHSDNTGKGGAVRKGFALSKGDYIVVQDADLEQNPNH